MAIPKWQRTFRVCHLLSHCDGCLHIRLGVVTQNEDLKENYFSQIQIIHTTGIFGRWQASTQMTLKWPKCIKGQGWKHSHCSVCGVALSWWTQTPNVQCLFAQLCPTLCRSLPGSSVHGGSPGKNAGVSCHALLQGIFPIQEWNPGLPHRRWIFFF